MSEAIDFILLEGCLKYWREVAENSLSHVDGLDGDACDMLMAQFRPMVEAHKEMCVRHGYVGYLRALELLEPFVRLSLLTAYNKYKGVGGCCVSSVFDPT